MGLGAVCVAARRLHPLAHRLGIAPTESYTRRVTETRKTVTIVFADVAGSTGLGERVDPETVRRVMERYFEEMRASLERHGGTVEKFIGDAVMAVFGIPATHEDDALRAVRAAAEMRERLAALNEELSVERGVTLAVRTGVNTGDVVAGDPEEGQAFATGDAVNVAARLEQAASPGEILIGRQTHELVRDAVRAEPVEPLELKGKAEPVEAWQLVDVLPHAPAFSRRIDAPFVGRERELATLRAAYERARDDGSCGLATVTGAPGIGKSRLVRELVGAVGSEPRVLVGRCLSYGEGITYWPLAEIVRQVAGSEPRSALSELFGADPDATLVTERILAAIGAADEAARTEEVFWATRLLLERLARERPLVVIVDDIHWAEPTLLDLIEYLVGFTRASVFVTCTARPELFDNRPDWPRAGTLELEALDDDESEALIDALLSESELPAEVRRRIGERAEGNPLFVEQMLALAGENGDGEIAIPATIQALLAARLDHLPAGERAVLVRGAVEGRLFHRGAVSALLPDDQRNDVPGRLMTLARKALVRPDESLFPGDDGFRFVHALVRDAAYEASPKELRAELHERFAEWLEQRAQRLAEVEEIVGYHLEESVRYRRALGEPTIELAVRSAARLAAAGKRAARRGDYTAASNLLSRARELLPRENDRRLDLALPLGEAQAEAGSLDAAERLFGESAAQAYEGGHEALAVVLEVELLRLRNQTDPAWSADEARRLAERALPILTAAGDDAGLARAWRLAASADWMQGKLRASKAASKRSLIHAKRADNPQLISDAFTGIGAPSWFGYDSISELIPFHEQIHAWARRSGYRATEAAMLFVKARIAFEQQRFDEAESLRRESFAIIDDLGLTMMRMGFSAQWSWGELRRQPADVEVRLRENYERLKALGETGFFSTLVADLALVLALRGALDEADQLVEESRQTGSGDDAGTQIGWRRSLALILARRGDLAEAEALAREAVGYAHLTEYAESTAEAHLALGDVLHRAGRPDEAARELERALSIYEQKEFVTSANAVRTELAEKHP